MNNIFYEYNYLFYRINFNKYHCTDNSHGSPMNYVAHMTKGHCRLTAGYNSIEVSEGEYFFIPKGLSYKSYWYGNDEISFISLGFANMPSDSSISYILQKLDCTADIAEKIQSIPLGVTVTAKTLGIFYSVLAELMPNMRHIPAGREISALENAKKYICDNPYADAEKIAEACFMSQSYLYYLFKKYLKSTPNDFKQSLICDKATSLLLTTDKTVEEISDMLNFSSASYFRKVMKKRLGKTPSDIRKYGAI